MRAEIRRAMRLTQRAQRTQRVAERKYPLRSSAFSALSALKGLAWRRIGVALGGLALSALLASAQSSPPPVSYFRSYVNDLPDQLLVTVTVSGASNVSCFTIEETLPSPASAESISSGGVWVPALNAIRWGPFFNTVTTSVTYRLTGLPGSYPVNGGSWMDGQWYFSPGVTMVTVLPVGGGSAPAPPPQLPATALVQLGKR